MNLATFIGPRVRGERRTVRWLRRLATFPLPEEARRRLLRAGGIDLAPRVGGLQRCWFESPRVSVGEDTFFNAGSWLEGGGEIRIGANSLIGPEVLVLTSTHTHLADGRVDPVTSYLPTTIGDDCWLGARSVVLPGVSIADRTVIGAGAVVTKDTEPGGVYAGVPARRIR